MDPEIVGKVPPVDHETEFVRGEASIPGRFAAAVVGLGRIGQGYDYGQSGTARVVTHATGFACHRRFKLVAAVDPDGTQRERFERKFGVPAYRDVKSLMARHQPEVFSICVPTAERLPVFEEVIDFRPRAVLCEKPIAPSVAEARRIVSLAEQSGCALAVNYMRRFEPGAMALKKALEQGAVGEIYKGTVWYSKGMLNNGSHFVDLLRFLLGEVTEIRLIRDGRSWDERDPEPDLALQFGRAEIYFLAGREECFSMGEVALIGSRGMVSYREKGAVIEMRGVERSRVFPEYVVLSRDVHTIPTDMTRYQWHVLEALYRHLVDGMPLNSDGQSATETLAVVERLFALLGSRDE